MRLVEVAVKISSVGKLFATPGHRAMVGLGMLLFVHACYTALADAKEESNEFVYILQIARYAESLVAL